MILLLLEASKNQEKFREFVPRGNDQTQMHYFAYLSERYGYDAFQIKTELFILRAFLFKTRCVLDISQKNVFQNKKEFVANTSA